MKGNILLMVILVLLVATACGGASPVQPEPESTATPLLLADFAACSGTNGLGGAVGAAYTPPDLLKETYVKEADDGGCYVLMDYQIDQWAALYLLLPEADLTPYRQLVFDIMAPSQAGMSQPTIKLEFKKANGEVSILYVDGIGPEWQTRMVRLSEFGPSYAKPIETWTDISEFVVVMEQPKAGREGSILLDNIVLM